MNKKFDYFGDYSLEELENEREELLSDIDYLLGVIDSKDGSYRVSEFYEDLKNDRDKLDALNEYICKKGKTR